MIQRIWALMVKELLALLRDPRQRFIIIVPPILQVIVFSYAATFNIHHIPFAVFNQDHGSESRKLIANFSNSRNFQDIRSLRSSQAIKTLLDNKKVVFVLSIGPHFSSNLLLQKPAKVQIILDGRESNTALIALGYAQSIINLFNNKLSNEFKRQSQPIKVQDRSWFNENLSSRLFIVPGVIGIILLVVVVMSTALSVAREREQETFDQLLVTPIRPIEILIGKSIPGMLIGLVEVTLVLIVVLYWFQVPLRGSLPALYIGFILFILSGIGLGLMISSLVDTLQQALLGAFIFLTPSVILSGFATPISNMQTVVQFITYIDPLRYFLVIVRSIFLEGASITQLWVQYLALLLIGLASLFVSGSFFRKTVY